MTINQTGDDSGLRAETEALLTELRRVAHRKSRHSRWSRPFLLFCMTYYFGFHLSVGLLDKHLPMIILLPMHLLHGAMALTALLAFLPVQWMLWKSMVHIEKLVSRLGEDPRAVGAIAQLCYYSPDLSSINIFTKALLKVLPTVKASDARYISDDQMQALLALLTVHNRHRIRLRRFINLPFAVMMALQQVGDSRAIEPVRRLTTGRANRRYHHAAQECLIALKQHGEERERNRSLLLPSSLEAGTETLLRATTWTEEAQPELLLRAAPHEEKA